MAKDLTMGIDKLRLSDKASFSFGVFGKDAANTLVNIYYMFFLTQVICLNAVIVGAVFAVTRLLFGFASPLVGTMIDNTRSRLGKYRPWIMGTVILSVVALLSMFYNLSATDYAKYVFYLSFYAIWEIANLALDISAWAFLPALTNNTGIRNQMTSLAKTTSGLGSGLIAAGVPFFFTYFYGSEYEPSAYFALAAVVSVVMLLGGLCVFILNKEVHIVDSDIIKFKDLFKSLFSNDQLIAYFFSFLLINMAGALTNNFAIYFFAFDYGDIRYFGLFTLVAGLGQGIAVFTYPWLAKNLSIRAILVIAALSSILGYALMLVIIAIFGVSSITLLCAVSVLMLFSGGWLATASQSMLTDITDYGEYKLGNRTASVVFSANTMMWRILNAAIVLLLGVCLSAAGIKGVSLESGNLPEISLQGLWLIRLMMFGLPVIMLVSGLAVFLSKYKLNAKEMEHILEFLESRRLKAEQRRLKRMELKLLSSKLRDAKKLYRREKWYKKYILKDTSIMPKKFSLYLTKKRVSKIRNKDKD